MVSLCFLIGRRIRNPYLTGTILFSIKDLLRHKFLRKLKKNVKLYCDSNGDLKGHITDLTFEKNLCHGTTVSLHLPSLQILRSAGSAQIENKKKLLDRKTEEAVSLAKIAGGPTSYRYGVRPLTT